MQHADQIAQRITQLGGEPDFSPDGLLGRSHSEYVPGEGLVVRYLGDPTTRRVLEEILAKEAEHADDRRTLLARLSGDRGAEH